MKKLLLLLPLLLASCAYFHSTTYTYDPTSGKQVGETHMTGYAMLDSNGQITKASNRSDPSDGTNHWAPGTYVGDASGNASSTNIVAALTAVRDILNTVLAKAP